MSGFQLQRLGMLMEPESGNPMEAEGVLNSAAVRGPDRREGQYSRLGITRVKFNVSQVRIVQAFNK